MDSQEGAVKGIHAQRPEEEEMPLIDGIEEVLQGFGDGDDQLTDGILDTDLLEDNWEQEREAEFQLERSKLEEEARMWKDKALELEKNQKEQSEMTGSSGNADRDRSTVAATLHHAEYDGNQDFSQAANTRKDKWQERYLAVKTHLKEAELKIAMLETEKKKGLEQLELLKREASNNQLFRKDWGRCIPLQPRTTSSASHQYRHGPIYHCRCPSACYFKVVELPNAPMVRTSSPTQVVRMMQLLKRKPELAQDPDALRLLSLHTLMLPTAIDREKLWRILSMCPTIRITVEGHAEFENELEEIHANLLQKVFGPELLNPKRILTLLAPGVKPEWVPLAHRMLAIHNLDGQREEILELFKEDEYGYALLVVPFSTADSERDSWQKILNLLPRMVRCLVVAAPGSQIDWEEEQKFEMLVESLDRKDNTLERILPLVKHPTWQNSTLLQLGNSKSFRSYWEFIKEAQTFNRIDFPTLKVQKEQNAAKNTYVDGGKVGPSARMSASVRAVAAPYSKSIQRKERRSDRH